MKKVLINIQDKIDVFSKYYEESFLDIRKKYNVEIYNFYISGNIEKSNIDNLEKKGINMLYYSNEKDLLEQINILKKENNIYYINTFTETLIPITNIIKKQLGQKITDNPELFRNKKIQRELLLKYDEKIATNYQKINITNIIFSDLEKKIGLPFVIKPSNGIQSAGVSIIKNVNDFNIYKLNFNDLIKNLSGKINTNDLELIVEEFIDGDKYSIDYFVDEEGKITGITEPIFNLSADYLNIDDLFEYLIIASKEKLKIFKEIKFYDFIKNTVKATGIKNTFVHHEFKINSTGKLKTIELNGRIGGYRLEIYKESSYINLLDFIFEEKGSINIKNDFGVIQFYSEKEGILDGFNEKLINKIKELKSFFSINIMKKYVGGKVGLTSKGYGKVVTLRLKNNKLIELNEDLKFIKEEYNNLLILKK